MRVVYNERMDGIISIVIPSLNEEENLPVLLKSLSLQSDRNFEIVINDSGSKDKTKERVDGLRDSLPSLLFLTNPTKNVSQARNNGARYAKGKWIIFFDADVEVSPDFIEGVRKHMGKGLDAFTVWNRPKNSNIQGKLALATINGAMTLFQNIKPAANGPCIIMKKELFEKLKGFDDSIVFGEDFELIQRAAKLKARFAVFKIPILYVSTRRFEKEGLLLSGYKSLNALIHQLVLGPIRKPIFDYEMGGQYYRKRQEK